MSEIDDRNLGLRRHKCRICGLEGDFQSYMVREMMQGTRDDFEYFVCPKCNCLQIGEIPSNLGDYYGSSYYSMSKVFLEDKDFDSPVVNNDKVLDVGCGSGEWLYSKAMEGYGNLHGCDPFIEKEIWYGDRIHIRKCDITEIDEDGTYDLVIMRDSFEHVPNPREVLEKAAKLIKDDGLIALSLPTYPNIAFSMFETNWYQLDAPRHVVLHSIMSMKYLADQVKLEITKIQYNSDAAQIVYSFMYQKDISFDEITDDKISEYFSHDELAKIDKLSDEANANHTGDHMFIYLSRK